MKHPRMHAKNVEPSSITLQWFWWGGRGGIQNMPFSIMLSPPFRLSLPPSPSAFQVKGNPVRRPPMPYHRFTAGDIVAITPGKAPPTQAEMDSGSVLDGVVLQRCVPACATSRHFLGGFLFVWLPASGVILGSSFGSSLVSSVVVAIVGGVDGLVAFSAMRLLRACIRRTPFESGAGCEAGRWVLL